MKSEKAYNLLTQRLLAEGYTAENHPDYVFLPYGWDKEDPLNNLYGGFQYYGWHTYSKVFKTPCGIQCKGMRCITGMYYQNKNFTFEDDAPVIHCPYHNKGCLQKDAALRDAGIIGDMCNVHMVDEEYQYEGSVEEIIKMEEDEIRRKKIGFELMRNGRTCPIHMDYNQEKGEWTMTYNPRNCAHLKCRGQIGGSSQNICPILGRELDPQKGNVFYDIKIRRYRADLDGTLFEGQIDTHITKGVRLYEYTVSMDICRNIVKLCQDEIRQKVAMEYHEETFRALYHNREFTVEVINIRAEQRENRDLMQDLQDIKEGIIITHESDRIKQNSAMKKKRREDSKQKRIVAIERKILSQGYGNLESIDQKKACKLLGFDRIDELEAIREEKMQEEQEEFVQISMFDQMNFARDMDTVNEKEEPHHV